MIQAKYEYRIGARVIVPRPATTTQSATTTVSR
jgi:hypothetical protein